MALSQLSSWAGSPCGASDKPASCGAADKPEEKPASCGSACGAADKPEEKPAAGSGLVGCSAGRAGPVGQLRKCHFDVPPC